MNAAVEVETVTPGAIGRSEREFQGHHEVTLADVTRARRRLQVPAGSLRVSMSQRLARLVFHLLEPTSDDGVVTWNLVDEWLKGIGEVAGFQVRGVLAYVLEARPYPPGQPDVVGSMLVEIPIELLLLDRLRSLRVPDVVLAGH